MVNFATPPQTNEAEFNLHIGSLYDQSDPVNRMNRLGTMIVNTQVAASHFGLMRIQAVASTYADDKGASGIAAKELLSEVKVRSEDTRGSSLFDKPSYWFELFLASFSDELRSGRQEHARLLVMLANSIRSHRHDGLSQHDQGMIRDGVGLYARRIGSRLSAEASNVLSELDHIGDY